MGTATVASRDIILDGLALLQLLVTYLVSMYVLNRLLQAWYHGWAMVLENGSLPRSNLGNSFWLTIPDVLFLSL